MMLSIECIVEELDKHIQDANETLKDKHPECMSARIAKRKIQNLESAKIHLLRSIR